jgi:hypothetical protein
MAVGVAALWAAYAVGIWGYCLVRGYDVPFAGVFKATWPGPAAAAGPAGPVPDPGTGVFAV